MTKLKLQKIEDDKPVRLILDVPASLHRDLLAYGEALGQEAGTDPVPPVRLIGPMLERFIATDRGFAARRNRARA